MCIGELKIGETAIITNIKNSNTSYSDELNALGIQKGSKITCIRKSIFGKLLHIKCNTSTIVIRKNESKIIEVRCI